MSAVGADSTMAIALCQDGRRKRDGTPLPEYELDARVADVAHLQTLVGPDVRISSEHVSMMAVVQSDDNFAAVMRRAGIFFCRGGFTAFDQGLAGFMRVASRSRADALQQMVHDDQFLWIGVCAGAKIVGRDYLDMLNGVDVRYDAGVAPPMCQCLTDDRQLQLTSGVGFALDIWPPCAA